MTREAGLEATVPGTFLVVAGLGILLTGPSAIGKSELALALLDRGHALVADDATTLVAAPQTLWGHCPPPLRRLLLVRDVGVVDVVERFGPAAWVAHCPLAGVIALHHRLAPRRRIALGGVRGQRRLLGHKVPRLHLVMAPQRPMALVVECAAANLVPRPSADRPDARLLGRLAAGEPQPLWE
ncbi:MAG: HPr kinase/phosphorylase [Candidatus Competibacterales bacterium]